MRQKLFNLFNFSEAPNAATLKTLLKAAASTKSAVKQILLWLDLPSPPTQCLLCRNMQASRVRNICEPCFSRIERHQPCCTKCATPLPEKLSASLPKDVGVCGNCVNSKSALNQVWIASPYNPPVSSWLRGIKDRRQLIFLPPLCALLAEKLTKLDTKEIDILLPISIHWSRRLVRGYNQTELLAKCLSREMNIPLSTKILKRTSAVKSQRGLNKKQRIKNQRNNFSVKDQSLLLGKNVLLIDDIYTTGATAEEAAKAIRNAGATSVRIAAIARTPHPRDYNFKI